MKIQRRLSLATFFVVAVAVGGTCLAGEPAGWYDPDDLQQRLDYLQSEEFKANGGRCGTPDPWTHPEVMPWRDQADCTLDLTNPDAAYEPDANILLQIPVVVHIISNDSGTGNIPGQYVYSQIEVLNEDYQALAGSLGEAGTYTGISFVLATEDPVGNPTTGIDRVVNNTWFSADPESDPADIAAMMSALYWDPHRYLNFYTKDMGSLLGRAWFPQWPVGGWEDGVLIDYNSFGRNTPGYPYHLGRTATHEVGHWLGLLHPFQDGCGVASQPECYTTGDLICDTDPDASPSFYCTAGLTSCGGYLVPIWNYMEYTNDACMTEFSLEQANRAICSLTSYRPDVYTVINLLEVFVDGFESGTTDEWSHVVQ